MKKLKFLIVIFLLSVFSINTKAQINDSLQYVLDLVLDDELYWNEFHRVAFLYDTIYFEYEHMDEVVYVNDCNYISTLVLDTILFKDVNKYSCQTKSILASNTNLLLYVESIKVDTIYNVYQFCNKAPKKKVFGNNYRFLRPEYKDINIDNYYRRTAPIYYAYTYFNDKNNMKYLSSVFRQVPTSFCGNNYVKYKIYCFEDEEYRFIDYLDLEQFHKFNQKIHGRDTTFNITSHDKIFSSLSKQIEKMNFNTFETRPYIADTLYFNSPYYNIDTIIEIDETYEIIIKDDTLFIPSLSKHIVFDDFFYNYVTFSESDSCAIFNLRCSVKIFSDLDLHNKLMDEMFEIDLKYLDYYYLELRNHINKNIPSAIKHPYKLFHFEYAY